MATTVAALSAAAWAGLVLFRGNFWHGVVDDHLRDGAADDHARGAVPGGESGAASGDASAAGWPSVAAVVPARNEADVVACTLPSLALQGYRGAFSVTLVDDRSDDGTADVARAALATAPGSGRVRILEAPPLEPGWTGKLAALESGVRAVRARDGDPDFWLFTDADIAHDPDNVAALVRLALREGVDLASLMVRLHCENRWERLLIPAFVFFFAKLYPFAWAGDPRRRTAAAAGGCVLVSDRALQRIGGLASIRDRIIDDCALATEVKRSGGRLWLGLSGRTRSLRPYPTLEAIWAMVRRTAFVQLRRSNAVVAGTVAGMVVLYLVPPIATLAGLFRGDFWLAAAGAAGWLTMAGAYLPTLRAYGRPPFAALGLSAAALVYSAITVDSAITHARGGGAAWKGRRYGGALEPS